MEVKQTDVGRARGNVGQKHCGTANGRQETLSLNHESERQMCCRDGLGCQGEGGRTPRDFGTPGTLRESGGCCWKRARHGRWGDGDRGSRVGNRDTSPGRGKVTRSASPRKGFVVGKITDAAPGCQVQRCTSALPTSPHGAAVLWKWMVTVPAPKAERGNSNLKYLRFQISSIPQA
jgi:hypothetical protein